MPARAVQRHAAPGQEVRRRLGGPDVGPHRHGPRRQRARRADHRAPDGRPGSRDLGEHRLGGPDHHAGEHSARAADEQPRVLPDAARHRRRHRGGGHRQEHQRPVQHLQREPRPPQGHPQPGLPLHAAAQRHVQLHSGRLRPGDHGPVRREAPLVLEAGLRVHGRGQARRQLPQEGGARRGQDRQGHPGPLALQRQLAGHLIGIPPPPGPPGATKRPGLWPGFFVAGWPKKTPKGKYDKLSRAIAFGQR